MAKSNRMKITELSRTPGNVFVSVSPPPQVAQIQQSDRFYQDWTAAAKGIASDTPTAVETPTAEPTTESDLAEIRIYAIDCLSGLRTCLYTGHPADDTDALCQAYANLAEYRVEAHDAVDAKVYHPETYPIPTLADWVEVVNADTGEMIWVGLREDGFDARCRKYANTKGVGLRVDSAHLNHSQFYTPKNEMLSYARKNAEHFLKKHGVAITDAVGILAITMLGWASYVVIGVA